MPLNVFPNVHQKYHLIIGPSCMVAHTRAGGISSNDTLVTNVIRDSLDIQKGRGAFSPQVE